MRLAILVVGMCSVFFGSTSWASDSARGSLTSVHSAALLADAGLNNHVAQFGGASEHLANSPFYSGDSPVRGVGGAMAYVPAQNPASFVLPRLPQAEPRKEASARWNPAAIPLPATRTLEDHLLTGFVALMLIAYQLRRKHRFLRPHQFST